MKDKRLMGYHCLVGIGGSWRFFIMTSHLKLERSEKICDHTEGNDKDGRSWLREQRKAERESQDSQEMGPRSRD
jgi:hypothetical protein